MKTNYDKFIRDIKGEIVEKLNDYKGSSIYGSDLAYTLFECENCNGTVLFSTYATKEFIKANFDLFGEFIEYWSDNVGESLNPFSEPEKCHVILLLESAQSILSNCELVKQKWNDKILLTDAVIKKLKKQVMEFYGDLF